MRPARLVDRVLPDVPWRQWVLTLACPLRSAYRHRGATTSVVSRETLSTKVGDCSKME